jgi:hypothetical protein
MTDKAKSAANSWPDAIFRKLTVKELEAASGAVRESVQAKIRRIDTGFWMMEIRIAGKEETFDLVTTRRNTKVWRALEDAITFANQFCRPSHVEIELGGWVFVRLPQHQGSDNGRTANETPR